LVACVLIAGVTSGGKEPVEQRHGCALRLNEVNAFHRQGEIRVIRPGDEPLFRQIPGGKVEIIAWEPMRRSISGRDTSGHWIHAPTVIEDGKNREPAVWSPSTWSMKSIVVDSGLEPQPDASLAGHCIPLFEQGPREPCRSPIIGRTYPGRPSRAVRMIPSRQIPVDTMNRLLSSLRADLQEFVVSGISVSVIGKLNLVPSIRPPSAVSAGEWRPMANGL